MHSNSDQVVSLFSGAGGFSYGFSLAGIKPVCGAELDVAACQTYENNVGSPCHNVDLADTEPSFFREIVGGRSPFAIIGGPPCQGFSTAGPRNSEDPRNRLIFNYLNIVEDLKPRWFIFENVEGLLTSGRGRDVARLLAEFIRIGYSVRLEKVNLAAYGVPQTRKRVLIVGNRIGLDFDLPAAIYSYDSGKSKSRTSHTPAPTVGQALEGLGRPATTRDGVVSYLGGGAQNSYDASMRVGNDASGVTHHWSVTNERDANMYALLKMGGGMRDLPECYWHNSFQRRAFRRVVDGTPSEKRGGAPSGFKRLYFDRQSLTITGAASREFIHPFEDRSLTPRECARLQSFPDRYIFSGSVSAVNQQIGNAVPPIAAQVLATHLQEIDGLAGSGFSRLLAAPPRLLGFSLTEASGKSEALQATEKLLFGLMQKEIFFP